MTCYGCKGKGWVDSQYQGVVLCPICKGAGFPKAPGEDYDQDGVWLELAKGPKAPFNTLIASESMALKDFACPLSIIVHLMFDRIITPQGCAILDTFLLRRKLSDDELTVRGYIVDNGTVKTVNDIPVGDAYKLFSKWEPACLESQLITAFEVDYNRKGNPLFVDSNMAAIKITCSSHDDVALALASLGTSAEANGLKILNLKLHCTSQKVA